VQSVADIESRKIGDNLTIGPLLQSMPVPANSDFFPFVDLNAPRLRYMGENAAELPGLTVLPIPFLELLDGSTPPDPTAEPAATSALMRDRLVRRALAIRNAVASGSLNSLDPGSALFLSRIDMGQDRCRAKEGRDAWKVAVRTISDDTAAFLNPSELAEIWAKVTSSPCYRDLRGEDKAWADLLAAISRRRAPEIVTLGIQLLAADSANSADEVAYLTTVTAAAQVRMGELAQARSLLQAQLPRFNHAGQFNLALRELAALTAVPQ
jgi:spermidine synthase